MTRTADLPPHGTRARYVSRVAKCRCPRCRAENTRYQRARRDRLRFVQLKLPGAEV